MTPKEMSVTIIEKFKNCDEGAERFSAKKCGIVVCGQVKNELGRARILMITSIKDVIGIDNYFTGEISWWNQVEEELNKL